MFNLHARVHIFLLSIGPWVYRVLTLLTYFFSGIFLDSILNKYSSIETETRFLIVLFFLILPFNWARVTLICTPYAICHFLFFLAWFLMNKNRLLAIVFFFLSFNTNSLLVFYLLPFFDTYYKSLVNSRVSLKSLLSFSLRYFDFVLLPFLYFAIKLIFYKPTGPYEGYNEGYSLTSLFLSPVQMVYGWSKVSVSLVLLLVLTLVIYNVIFRTRLNIAKSKTNHNPYVFLLVGMTVFLCGAFPYWILGYVPVAFDWDSRHQLLLPLGFSIILVGFLGLARNFYIKNLLLSVFLSVCILMNVAAYRDCYIDWQKQSDLIAQFSQNDVIKNSQLVFFDDRTEDLNAFSRKYRFYEWNGLMAEAFGNEKRFGVDIEELESFKENNFLDRHKLFFSEHYRSANFSPHNVNSVAIVQIQRNYELSLSQRLKKIFLLRSSSLVKIRPTYLGKYSSSEFRNRVE
jgi:hypothetical protein